jgi:hypothetical protein
MTPEVFQAWLEDSEPPFTIKTTGGRSYDVPARSNFWAPESYPEVVCLALTGRGVIILRMSAIESVHTEHEMAAAR